MTRHHVGAPRVLQGSGVAAIITSAALVLAGCGTSEPTEPQAALDCEIPAGPLVFAVGGRANTPAVSGTTALANAVQAAAVHEATVTLVDTGGAPQARERFELRLESRNEAARAREAERNARALAEQLVQVSAVEPEANPLEALNKGAEAIDSATGGATVVLVDSGLQTMGALDYTKDGMLAADPQDVFKAVSAAGQLPDLTGITVILVGIGQTAPPQEPLDAGKRRTVQAHWRALVEGAGAACVAFDDTPRSAAPAAGLPAVTPFPVPAVESQVPTPESPRYLRDEVQFLSDEARYVDTELAELALRPIADWMTSTGSAVTVTGTTASDGTEEGRLRLSLMRAEAVKASLVSLGADASRIRTAGVGTNHPSHVDDLGPNGELLPGPAAQNRLVIVEVDAQQS